MTGPFCPGGQRLQHWLGGLLLLLLSFTAPGQEPPLAGETANANPVAVYLFWQKGCPHCETQISNLVRLAARNPDIQPHYLELGQRENRALYRIAAEALGLTQAVVPLTIVGNRILVGADSAMVPEQSLTSLVAACQRENCIDEIAQHALRQPYVDDPRSALEAAGITVASPVRDDSRQQLPVFGEVDLRRLSLPLLTILLAAVDGFNPCAMWVLVFLIGLLLGMQDPARRWLLGGTFLLTTAIVYYLMIAAWLGAFLVLGSMAWLRIVIGAGALLGGAWYLIQYFRQPEAICRVADESRRQRIMAGLRAATVQPRFLLALAAMVILAVSVNAIELLCSAGIPAIYTQVLALTPMPAWQYHAWIGLYVLVFLLDDLAIFALAMFTLDRSAIGSRYAHHAQLIGAIVLLAVGILLMLKPQWLIWS